MQAPAELIAAFVYKQLWMLGYKSLSLVLVHISVASCDRLASHIQLRSCRSDHNMEWWLEKAESDRCFPALDLPPECQHDGLTAGLRAKAQE